MKYIHTDKAPKTVGPYSQAIEAEGLIFCSGQIGLDSKGNLFEGTIPQLNQIMRNIEEVLKAAGSSLSKVIKTTIFLKNISEFQQVNEAYGTYFSTHKPARSTVEVSNLPKGALIEIEAIAVK
ncbi:MAG: RidA family protein [bacterium]|nr:RidA family protein [bacterium]